MRQPNVKNSFVNDVAAQPKRRLVDVSNETGSIANGENHVAMLQDLIYDKFSDFDPQAEQSLPELETTTERIVATVSRIGGVVVLVAALGLVVSFIF